jgi:hypothetical protein
MEGMSKMLFACGKNLGTLHELQVVVVYSYLTFSNSYLIITFTNFCLINSMLFIMTAAIVIVAIVVAAVAIAVIVLQLLQHSSLANNFLVSTHQAVTLVNTLSLYLYLFLFSYALVLEYLRCSSNIYHGECECAESWGD